MLEIYLILNYTYMREDIVFYYFIYVLTEVFLWH